MPSVSLRIVPPSLTPDDLPNDPHVRTAEHLHPKLGPQADAPMQLPTHQQLQQFQYVGDGESELSASPTPAHAAAEQYE